MQHEPVLETHFATWDVITELAAAEILGPYGDATILTQDNDDESGSADVDSPGLEMTAHAIDLLQNLEFRNDMRKALRCPGAARWYWRVRQELADEDIQDAILHSSNRNERSSAAKIETRDTFTRRERRLFRRHIAASLLRSENAQSSVDSDFDSIFPDVDFFETEFQDPTESD